MPKRPQFRISSWLFVRLLGGIYAVAFGSLWVQVEGLIGSRGILPAADLLERVAARLGPERFWRLPTLGWLDASDLTLELLCATGVVLGLLVLLGWLQLQGLIALWVGYLSLVVLGQDFLSFQWDVLLLEAGLLAIFLPGAGWKPRGPLAARPPRLAVWLLRLLAFKLIFSSGAVKLASGDPAWRGLTALQYHYETQPLPNPVAWLAHQLPDFFQFVSVALVFALELGVPLLFFAPSRWRRTAAGLSIAFQLLLALTGNFAFFNLLALALVLLLLDDAWWMRFWRLIEPASEAPALGRPRRFVLVPLALVWLAVSALHVGVAVGFRGAPPAPLGALHSAVAPWRSINGYGLFAVMTTVRNEIVVEGSDDGESWSAYEFRWKPGAPDRMPPIVAPHQPRLDWQLWFAALGEPAANPWFVAFMARLAGAEPAVLGLLADDPFDGRPPAYLRARLAGYRFTGYAELADGVWWRVAPAGAYLPATPAAELAALLPAEP